MTYNTRSEALSSKPSAIIDRATLTRQRSGVERWSALVVLLISIIGTIAVCNGGWLKLAQGLLTLVQNPQAAVGVLIMSGIGLAIQGVLTWLQWSYKDNPPIAYGSRVVDAALTLWGWGPLFIVSLTEGIASIGAPSADLIAWAILGLVSYLVAWYPESRLVR